MTENSKIQVMVFNNFIKTLKKDVPNSCTFIGPIKDTKGELFIKYRVLGKDYYLSIPQNYDITIADRVRIRNLIEETCQNTK